MKPDEIHQLLRDLPFKPFTIKLSNGSAFIVQHPENALLTRSTLFLTTPSRDEKFADKAEFISLLHIASIEMNQ